MECPKCGNIIGVDETSCKNCGERINDNTANSISTGGGKTELPSEEEKAAALKELQIKEQQRIIMEQQKQNNATQQEYYMLKEQLETAKKNSNVTLVIIVVLIAVVAAFGVILINKKMNDNTSKSIKDVPVTQSASESNELYEGEEHDKESKKVEPNMTDIEISSYIFSFPENYETTLQDGMGISIDRTNKVQFVYTVMNTVSYDSVLYSQEEFKTYLNGVGFSVVSSKEVTYGNRKWLIYEGTLSGHNAMYAITALNNVSTFQTTVFNLGNKINGDVMNELSSIIDNAKVKPSSNSEKPKQDIHSGGTTQNNRPSSGSVTA